MNNLRLKNFKAYRDEFDKLFENNNGYLPIKNNFLLYGDNGSGKSSIYEAIKVIFFRDKLEALIPDADTPDDEEQNIKNFWAKYDNKKENKAFEIQINGEDYKSFSIKNYQLFMIQIDELCTTNKIQFNKFLEKFDFSIESISNFCSENYSEIETNINLKLESVFREKDIKITIDAEDDFYIKVEDTLRGIESKKEINKYFNEAKINLILLLLLFESIKKAQDNNKKRILVLDDFITSLDMSNRTFLMKYILENFEEFQIVIFTHNIYFYNLIMYLVNDIYKQKNKWQYANLYEIDNHHKLYINNNLIELSKLRKQIYGQNPNYSTIGNQLRQKFERLLYEFSKILMIGGVEESNKILEILDKIENIYLYREEYIDEKNKKKIRYKNSNNLVFEIEKLIIDDSSIDNIKDKIIEYKKVDTFLPEILKIIRELKLYQKISMHPLSHGRIGENPMSQKEIEKSLELLEVFQEQMKNFVNKTIT